MDIQEHLMQKKNFYKNIIEFLHSEECDDFESFKFEESKDHFCFKDFIREHDNLIEFLKLIAQISNHHHRYPNFINKIEKILLSIKNEIKQAYSNFEIFRFFADNKLILLFLFENDFIHVDEEIVGALLEKNSYEEFFYDEIKEFFSQDRKESIEQQFSDMFQGDLNLYYINRHIGENDSYLSKLIREDSIDEFVTYANRTNLSLSTTIKQSVFETNLFLLDKKPTLIEYSSFFGSVQIFNYLRLNHVELTSSLWLYAIHSNDAELIHLLEENHVKPPNSKYIKCLKESIKCHHNEIGNYILNNYLFNELNEMKNEDILSTKNFVLYSYKYHNYEYFQPDIKLKDLFYLSVKYDYIVIVKLLLNSNHIKISNEAIEFQCLNEICFSLFLYFNFCFLLNKIPINFLIKNFFNVQLKIIVRKLYHFTSQI